MSNVDNNAEKPSGRAKVVSAVTAVAIIVCAIFVVLVFTQGANRNLNLAMDPRETAPNPTPTAKPADFRQRVDAEPDMPTRQSSAQAGSRDDRSATDPSLVELLQGMENARPGRGERAPMPMPNLADGQSQQGSRAMQSRSSRLGGVISRPAETIASANYGRGAVDADGVVTVPAGTVIDLASTSTASSDFPGAPVLGVVTRPVYGPGNVTVIPQGTRMLAFGAPHDGPNAILQGRMGLASVRFIRPDGTDIEVEGTAVDASGVGAIKGPTRRHWGAQIGGVLAYALIGAATLGATSDEPTSTASSFEMQAATGASQQVTPFARKYLQVQPTVTLPVGKPFRVVLEQPLRATPYIALGS